MRLRWLLFWCTLWATAFGFLEAAVVVYLREITYPDGFELPLREFELRLLWTEIVREATTLVLLVGLAVLAARNAMRRFAVFAFCFGVWDIVYYLALKIFLGWPSSLMDWDVLFLIPVPWTSPVLAPVLVSLALIAAGVLILREPEQRDWSFLRRVDWLIEILGAALILESFFWSLPALAGGEAPTNYPWWLFLGGWLGGIGWFWWRWSKRNRGPTRISAS